MKKKNIVELLLLYNNYHRYINIGFSILKKVIEMYRYSCNHDGCFIIDVLKCYFLYNSVQLTILKVKCKNIYIGTYNSDRNNIFYFNYN